MNRRTWAAAWAAVPLLVGVVSCSSDGSSRADGSNPSPAPVSVVASTNVYGDIATEIGGDDVNVTSIISDTSVDPHSYEADTRVELELSRADVVIENGGGYDDFVDTLLKTANSDDAAVVNVVDLSGKTAPAGGELNEHVWYDFPTVEKLADALAKKFSAVAPADADTFAANAATFTGKIKQLIKIEVTIKSAHAGEGVAITEPLPLYMTEAAGLSNKTSEQFSEAVEEGEDMPPLALRDQLNLFSGKKVAVLVYNAQTSGQDTEQIVDAAKKNDVPVVPVTETLPDGKDYIEWMRSNLAALQSALE